MLHRYIPNLHKLKVPQIDHMTFYQSLNTKFPFPSSVRLPNQLISDQLIRSIKHKKEQTIQYKLIKSRERAN